MKIVIFSVGPVFPNHVHGGSQKILRDVAVHLGSVGNNVRILCVRRSDNSTPFELAPNVHVLPILRLKPTYPEPYYTAPANLTDLIFQVRRHVEWSDLLYVHDAELPFHDLYKDRPTVFSFRDFVYPDTLVGAFGFRRDALILNCAYAARCVVDAFSQFLPGIAERIVTVPNGVDLDRFAPERDPSRSADLMGFLEGLPETTFTLLYPHRPDPRKGIIDSVKITAAFQRRISAKGLSVKLLVPVWMDGEVSSSTNHEYQAIYKEVATIAAELGITNSVHFHRWVPTSMMPDYFALGDVTLSIGSFVETFGNVHLESIACGTPCVVARVAAHAYNLPEPFIAKVPYGDISSAVECVERYCSVPYDATGARRYIADVYPFKEMLKGYERVFLGTSILDPLSVELLPELRLTSHVKLAAWCRFDGLGVYNDYSYGRTTDPRSIQLAQFAAVPLSVTQLVDAGFTPAEIEAALFDATLVRVREE